MLAGMVAVRELLSGVIVLRVNPFPAGGAAPGALSGAAGVHAGGSAGREAEERGEGEGKRETAGCAGGER